MGDIFVVGRGQYENVGDIILRRQLLDWLRPVGTLHVYVGQSPPGYDVGLQLAPEDVVYRSFRRWYRAALRSALRGGASYVFKPGEIQLTLVGMKEHLAMLPLLASIRLRHGRVIRAGSGTRNFAPLPRALMRPSISLSDVTLWRDTATAHYMGHGSPMPDLAFGEGACDREVTAFAESDTGRDVMVVSLRADEPVPPYPTPEWLAGVRAYADRHNLDIWLPTQVFVDNERNHRLAADLGGQLLPWDDLSGHEVQEERLRALYRRTALALSDRLHVIIAAFTEGAIPVGSLSNASDKVDRHFETIGISGITMNTTSTDTAGVEAQLSTLAGRRHEMFSRLQVARADLSDAKARIQQVLATAQTAESKAAT